MTQIFNDRFQLLELIGKGGIGEVYRGRDLHTNTVVAVKLLKLDPTPQDMKSVERFQQEAAILGHLEHPHIVKIVASGKDGDQYYIVMEYLEGPSLLQVIRQENPVPIRRVLEIALDISDALIHAHRLNIIHRDLKPTNVLFSQGVPHLTDFGVARLGKNSDLTQTGLVIGSYNYLSPEACNGKLTDERSDIWAFGVMLHEMLTGQVPFSGDSPGMILNGILNNPVPDLNRFRADIPLGLQSLLYAMLEKRPEFRMDSMRRVGAELEHTLRSLDTGSITQGEITQAVPTTSTYFPNPVTTAKPSTVIVLPVSQRWLVSLFILGVMVLGVLAFWWGSREPAKEADFLAVAVEPVAPDEYMILVGQLEPINTDEREVTRFIINDLQLQLEQTVPYTRLKIREYPYIIQNEADARKAAEKNTAAVVVWGHYTSSGAELDIQLGTLEAFPFNQISSETLSQTLDVRVRVQDMQQETIAPYILNMFIVMHSATGDEFDAGGAVLGRDEMDEQAAEIIGETLGARVHRFFGRYFTNTQDAIELMNTAIAVDADNPILYHLRALAYQKQGDFAKGDQDLETASLIGGDAWFIANILRANNALFRDEPEQGIGYLNPVMVANPEDWFIWYLRGTLYYLTEDYAAAKADFEKSVSLQPTATFPYISLAQLATREGRLDEANAQMQKVLNSFTDPELANRITLVMFGDAVFYSHALSAYSNFIVGQHSATIDSIDAALKINPDFTDLLFLKGISLCSLDDYEAAEEAYTQALEIDPEFIVIHLLRAEVRSQRRDFAGVAEDLEAVRESNLSETLQPYIELGLTGEFSCKDFLQNTPEIE